MTQFRILQSLRNRSVSSPRWSSDFGLAENVGFDSCGKKSAWTLSDGGVDECCRRRLRFLLSQG